ncbi:hypothetical protein AB0M43_38625 [Longispora sp. NPDC051575]|uniref:hypothetical protein n=1 Tax=Longispora sp. NPDC051575 TaxID=3154943 RepID=UPI00343C9F59
MSTPTPPPDLGAWRDDLDPETQDRLIAHRDRPLPPDLIDALHNAGLLDAGARMAPGGELRASIELVNVLDDAHAAIEHGRADEN